LVVVAGFEEVLAVGAAEQKCEPVQVVAEVFRLLIRPVC
jgi:hypothetical protein